MEIENKIFSFLFYFLFEAKSVIHECACFFLVSFDCETLGFLFLLSQASDWYIICAISLFKLGVIKFLEFSCLKIQEKFYLIKLLCFTQIKLLDFVVYIYYSWYVASISVFWLNLVKIENSKIWVWTLENSFYFFKKKKKFEQDWEVFFFVCLINCCKETSYIVNVKIHVKQGRNRC